MGSVAFQVRKFVLVSGLVPMILLILASTSGVIFSRTFNALSDCYNWATVLAPIKAVDEYLNLIHQAIATSTNVDSSYFSTYAFNSLSALTFFSVWKGV